MGSERSLARAEASQYLESTVLSLCRKNFLVFMKAEMGLEIARPQREWWDLLKTGNDTLILAHRDSGKSQAIVRAYGIWRAKYYDHFVREILVLGADTDSACENLEKIKHDLDANESLRYLIPHDRKGYNTAQRVKLANGVVLRAKGFLSPLRGRHPQLILLDDVLNERNTASQDFRDKIRAYFSVRFSL